mmetsp:Transcript_67903/g.122331  ORF Transcript_67903/g.122331 Transcript_67903/m.122331 type:complete len:273 (+) Transcript_67903:428-1246(+)
MFLGRCPQQRLLPLGGALSLGGPSLYVLGDELSDLLMGGSRGFIQRGQPEVVFAQGVCLCLQQHLRGFHMPAGRCHVQRCAPVVVRKVRHGRRGQERLQPVQISHRCSMAELRGQLHILRHLAASQGVAAQSQEQLRPQRIWCLRRLSQGREAPAIEGVCVGPAGHQQLHLFEVAVGRRHVQRRALVVVRGIHLGARVEEPLQAIQLSSRRCVTKESGLFAEDFCPRRRRTTGLGPCEGVLTVTRARGSVVRKLSYSVANLRLCRQLRPLVH